MRGKIDQSGKLEDTRVPSVLAVTNDIAHIILIPAGVKRAVVTLLRQKRKPKRSITLLMFSACLFLLLKDSLNRVTEVLIDLEYADRDADIRGSLLYQFHRHGLELSKERIVFGQVGRKTKAHKFALAVYRGKRMPDKVVTVEELSRVLGISQTK